MSTADQRDLLLTRRAFGVDYGKFSLLPHLLAFVLEGWFFLSVNLAPCV